MGDLVLTEDEINPVMQRLIVGGIEISVTAFEIFPTAERESRDMMGEMDAPSISVDHSMRC
jgi:hypothetical protein